MSRDITAITGVSTIKREFEGSKVAIEALEFECRGYRSFVGACDIQTVSQWGTSLISGWVGVRSSLNTYHI